MTISLMSPQVPKTKDSVIRRLIGILSQYFSVRPRSRNSAGESYEDLDHGGDGSTDAAEPPKEIESGEVELEHGEVDLEGGEIDESPEDGEDGDENFDPPDDVYHEDEVHIDKLAYHMGGTPRPTPRPGSPWSPWSSSELTKHTDCKPEPNSAADVAAALKKLEYLDLIQLSTSFLA